MQTLLEWLVGNALAASVLAAVALWVGYRFPRKPALVHACWLLVLVKLLTPPVYTFTVINITISPTEPTLSEPVAKQAPHESPESLSALAPRLEDYPPEEWEVEELLEWYQSTWDFENWSLPSGEDKPAVLVPLVGSGPSTPPTAGAVTASFVLPAWLEMASSWLAANWLLSVIILSLSGTGIVLVATAVRMVRFHRLLRFSEQPSAEVEAEIHRLVRHLGLKRAPEILVVPARVGPLLAHARGRAVIVLPRGLLDEISREELRTVLAHELTHYRRGDHFWRYLELAAVAFYWWLPSAWLASRRLRQAEEECCDAGVVASLPELAGTYATALVRSLSFVTGPGSPCPALTSGLGPVTLLKRRLTMMRQHVERRLGLRGWLLLAAVAGVALPVGFSMAQEPPEPPTPPGKVRASTAEQDRRTSRAEEAVRAERRRATADDDEDTPRPRRPVPGRPPMAPPAATAGSPMTPALPPMGEQGMVGGMIDDMRSSADMAVRMAELDLRAKKLKVRAAQSAINLLEAELKRATLAAGQGAVPETDVQYARAKLENAGIEVEMAKIEVERGELALEQARKRTSTVGRLNRAGPGGMGGGMSSGGGLPPGGLGGMSGGPGGNFGPGGGAFGQGGGSGFGGSMPGAPGAVGGGGGRGGQPGFTGRRSRDGDSDETPPAPPRAVTPPAAPGQPSAAAAPATPSTRTAPPAVAARPNSRGDGEVDGRDERIRSLERELREMRRALDEMRRNKRDEPRQ